MGKAVDVTVSGRVQGVSFRAYTQQEADRLGVTGWVSNEPDGTVAGHFEGADAAVDALVEWCRHGPRLADVDRVDVQPGEQQGASRFDVR
ncbi:MAG: acylphosphatase [Nocardioides sp.]